MGPDAWTCWMIMRSLETLHLRMKQQAENARNVAEWLSTQAQIRKVLYPSLLRPIRDKDQFNIYMEQCSGTGSMIAFYLTGGEEEAFAFLNNLSMVKLAVSLGSTESLAEHPYTMTHLNMQEDREKLGISPSLIRLSIGIENTEDIITDLANALEAVAVERILENM